MGFDLAAVVGASVVPPVDTAPALGTPAVVGIVMSSVVVVAALVGLLAYRRHRERRQSDALSAQDLEAGAARHLGDTSPAPASPLLATWNGVRQVLSPRWEPRKPPTPAAPLAYAVPETSRLSAPLTTLAVRRSRAVHPCAEHRQTPPGLVILPTPPMVPAAMNHAGRVPSLVLTPVSSGPSDNPSPTHAERLFLPLPSSRGRIRASTFGPVNATPPSPSAEISAPLPAPPLPVSVAEVRAAMDAACFARPRTRSISRGSPFSVSPSLPSSPSVTASPARPSTTADTAGHNRAPTLPVDAAALSPAIRKDSGFSRPVFECPRVPPPPRPAAGSRTPVSPGYATFDALAMPEAAFDASVNERTFVRGLRVVNGAASTPATSDNGSLTGVPLMSHVMISGSASSSHPEAMSMTWSEVSSVSEYSDALRSSGLDTDVLAQSPLSPFPHCSGAVDSVDGLAVPGEAELRRGSRVYSATSLSPAAEVLENTDAEVVVWMP
jgi:hypothetical protein